MPNREARRQQFTEFMSALQAADARQSRNPAIPDLPEKPKSWTETAVDYAPEAIRGVGALFGVTPWTGAAAGGAADVIAQAVENLQGEREGIDPRQAITAAGVGAVGGGLAGSIGKNIMTPGKAALKAIPWAAAAPVIQSLGQTGELPDASDVATSTAIGAGTAYGLGALARKFGIGGFKEPVGEAPPPPKQFEIETTAQPGGQTLRGGKKGPKVANVLAPPPIKASGEVSTVPEVSALAEDPYARVQVGSTSGGEAIHPRNQRAVDAEASRDIRDAREATRVQKEAQRLADEQAARDAIEKAKTSGGYEPTPPRISETVSAPVPGGKESMTTLFAPPNPEDAADEGADAVAEVLGVKTKGKMTRSEKKAAKRQQAEMPPEGSQPRAIYDQWTALGRDHKTALKMAEQGRTPTEKAKPITAAAAEAPVTPTAAPTTEVTGGHKVAQPYEPIDLASEGVEGAGKAALGASDAGRLVNPLIETESILASRGGTSAVPEARDLNPFNAERRGAGSPPLAGGARAGDPTATVDFGISPITGLPAKSAEQLADDIAFANFANDPATIAHNETLAAQDAALGPAGIMRQAEEEAAADFAKPVGAGSTAAAATFYPSRAAASGESYKALQELFKSGTDPSLPAQAPRLAGRAAAREAREAGIPSMREQQAAQTGPPPLPAALANDPNNPVALTPTLVPDLEAKAQKMAAAGMEPERIWNTIWEENIRLVREQNPGKFPNYEDQPLVYDEATRLTEQMLGRRPIDPEIIGEMEPTQRAAFMAQRESTPVAAPPTNVTPAAPERRQNPLGSFLGGRRAGDTPVETGPNGMLYREGTAPIPEAPATPDAPGAQMTIEEMRAKIDASKGRPGGGLWNSLMSERGIGGGERGIATPEILSTIAGGALGASLGALTTPDDPTIGAAVGFGAGAALPTMISKYAPELLKGLTAGGADALSKAGSVAGQKHTAAEIVGVLPSVMRANLLTSPNLLNNAIIGPWSSGMAGAIELKLAGDPRGARLLELMTPENWGREFAQSWDDAKALISSAQERHEGQVFLGDPNSKANQLMSAPGTIISMGDVTTRRIGMMAGLSEDEVRALTFTSEPQFGITKGLVDYQRRNPLVQFLLPFARTTSNVVEQGALRTPGLGRHLNSLVDNPVSSEVQNIRELLGAGAAVGGGVAGYYGDPALQDAGIDSPITSRFFRSLISNGAGPYSLLATGGFAAGKALEGGADTGAAIGSGLKGAFRQLPLPTADIPFQYIDAIAGNAKGEHPIPAGILPNIVTQGLEEAGPQSAARRPQRRDAARRKDY